MIKRKLKSYLKQLLKFVPPAINKSIAHYTSQNVTGYRIFDLTTLKGLSHDDEYIKTYKSCLSKAEDENTDNIYKLLRHLNLYSYIEDILRREVPGDFAECGCWNGNSLFATKHFIDKYKSMKSLHVFDSFEGLSEFQEKDYEDNSIIVTNDQAEEKRKYFISSYSKLIKKTNEYSRIYINKGWIPDIFRTQNERKYCFVHIDVDLYEPTLECHKYFFERLSNGGIIVCDDYGYSDFPGAASAVDEFIESLPNSSYSHFIKNSVGGSILIK
tara:strand:+ start:438 stop:1250 length:813 start_codon:yes stop_codon:yes gene_type:complete